MLGDGGSEYLAKL